jgi:hypothetical protein
MRKYRFLKGLVLGVMIGAASATVHHWDTSTPHTSRYNFRRYSGNTPNYAIPPGPKINEFVCIGSEKDCGQVHDIPIPSTIWLLITGLIYIVVQQCKQK